MRKYEQPQQVGLFLAACGQILMGRAETARFPGGPDVLLLPVRQRDTAAADQLGKGMHQLGIKLGARLRLHSGQRLL